LNAGASLAVFLAGNPPLSLSSRKSAGKVRKAEELYSYSCAALHSPNPYRTAPERGSQYSVNEWLERFRDLLAVHRIQLLERKEAWIVIVPRHGDVSVSKG